MADTMEEAERKIKKALEITAQEFGSVRTGRASPSLVERLQVDYYGTMTPLYQIATISAPEARLLVIQPYDRNSIAEISKAITQSDLGFVLLISSLIPVQHRDNLTAHRHRHRERLAARRQLGKGGR